MLFWMVQPMACSSSSNDSLQLVCLDPYNLLYSPITLVSLHYPHRFRHSLPSSIALPVTHRNINPSFWRRSTLNPFISLSLRVPYGSWFSLNYVHVDVPWRVQHDYFAFSKSGELKFSKVTIDPLLWPLLHIFPQLFFYRFVDLFILFVDLVVNILAILHVSAGIQIRAIPETLVCVGIDDLLEVNILAKRQVLFSSFNMANFSWSILAKFSFLVVLQFELSKSLVPHQ